MTVTTSVPPRFRHVPLFTSSAGQDAIDLAEVAGLTLDPWQQQVLIDGLAESNGRWCAMEVGLVVPRQNGKGGVLEALELFGLFLDPRCQLITHTAHRFDTCLDHFRRVRELVESTPDLLERVKDNGRGVGDTPSGIKDSNGKESIELDDGTRLAFKARSKGSGRGFSGDLVVLDEAFWLQDLGSLIPTLSARQNPQVWYASSAPLPRDESDRLRKVVRRGRALASGSEVDPDEPPLTYMEWSAPDDADLDDPDALRASNPAMEVGRITVAFSRVERAALDAEEFARERLGIFDDSEGEPRWTVISEDVWRACQRPLPESWPQGRVTYAAEASPDRAWTSLAVAGDLDDGVAVEVGERRPGCAWFVDRIVELRDTRGLKALVMDTHGALAPYVRDVEAAGVEVVAVDGAGYAMACGLFHDALLAGSVLHFGQGDLDDTVSIAKRRPKGDTFVWDRRGVDMTPLAAVSMAHWAHLMRTPPEEVLIAWA